MNYRIDFKEVPGAPAALEDGGFPNDYWTIGEMSRHYDVSLRTLRFYEDRGLITPMRHGGSRFYDARSRQRLERVMNAKTLGFTLTRIHQMIQSDDDLGLAQTLAPGEIVAQITLLERQKADIDKAIGDLRAAHAQSGDAHQAMARTG
ncbi:MAG: MerR family transcriptional regulator [Beijerinckiaceae bacterium]|nr:MerR family transcriptional regulator [Beijerinckiaceae bacterium]